jgi:hypothetical protein
MKTITFVGSPRLTNYSGSHPGVRARMFPGDVREVSDEVAVYLLESFPGLFRVEGAAKKVPSKKAPDRAIKATGNKSPPVTKKSGFKPKKKGSKS